VIKSSKLTYHGVEMPVATKGVFARQRIFTAPDDGRLFKWTLGALRVTVSFDDKQ